MDNLAPINQRKLAQIAGYALVLMAIVAGFGYGYLFEGFYDANSEVETVKNLSQSPGVMRQIIASFVFIIILDVVVAWALYLYFKPLNSFLSLLSAWLRLTYVAMLGASILNLFLVLNLLDSASQKESLLFNLLGTFLSSWSCGLIVFGAHLLLLGYLMLQSQIPKAISVLTVVAAICYLGTSISNLLIPAYIQWKDSIETALSLPMALGELALALWLIIKGGKK